MGRMWSSLIAGYGGYMPGYVSGNRFAAPWKVVPFRTRLPLNLEINFGQPTEIRALEMMTNDTKKLKGKSNAGREAITPTRDYLATRTRI